MRLYLLNLIKKNQKIRKVLSYLVLKITLKSSIYRKNKKKISDLKVLEIGGPSSIFESTGLFPLYKIALQVDNCNFSGTNFWSQVSEGKNFKYDHFKKEGQQFIQDATDLNLIASLSYDIVCSSHVIEHIANPIKALYEWSRVLKQNGYLLLIVPNKVYTYDRNRPITPLSHIIEDYQNNIGEDDTTHFNEIIDLHDLTIDSTVNSFVEHKRRTLNNWNERIAHHHVFDEELIKELIKYAGFNLLGIETRMPFHIIALAQKQEKISI